MKSQAEIIINKAISPESRWSKSSTAPRNVSQAPTVSLNGPFIRIAILEHHLNVVGTPMPAFLQSKDCQGILFQCNADRAVFGSTPARGSRMVQSLALFLLLVSSTSKLSALPSSQARSLAEKGIAQRCVDTLGDLKTWTSSGISSSMTWRMPQEAIFYLLEEKFITCQRLLHHVPWQAGCIFANPRGKDWNGPSLRLWQCKGCIAMSLGCINSPPLLFTIWSLWVSPYILFARFALCSITSCRFFISLAALIHIQKRFQQ